MQIGEIPRIALTIFLAIAIALALYFVVISVVVDPYLETGTWKLISNNYATYANESPDHHKIYFVGNSQVMNAVDPKVIERGLAAKNLSYTVYNLGVNFDTPLQRSIELTEIIRTKPDLVVYGDSYCSFSSRYRYVPDDNLALVSDKITLDDYSRSLFDKDQLSLIDQNKLDQLVFKRKFIVSGVKQKLGITLGGRDEIVNDTLTLEMKKIIAQNPYDEFYAPVDAGDNVQKKAFIHFRDELRKNNISFVYIHMPMDSLRVETIPQSTKTNYYTYLNSTGVKYYNMESTYTDDNFFDLVHLNRFGKQRFSTDMPDLIAGELR
jgi:hypothetical protein